MHWLYTGASIPWGNEAEIFIITNSEEEEILLLKKLAKFLSLSRVGEDRKFTAHEIWAPYL